MEKRGTHRFAKIGIFLLIIISISHLSIHYLIYGTGIQGFAKNGISGIAVGETQIFQETQINSIKSIFGAPGKSLMIILVEWVLLATFTTFTLVKHKINIRSEIASIDLEKRYKKSPNKTDLDILYDMLQENESISLSAISKIFRVNKETALQWTETLESGRLAYLKYPRMGEPLLMKVGKDRR
ncbi:MAG: hypothetical protein Q8P57_05505 [Candidatus Pacearchaeota archaeon]|nr:hypothetical protein [Candidatus Pacearchaeota archaeon]